MTQSIPPSAELFVATGCIHCPLVLKELSEQLKQGFLASLKVTNIAVDSSVADALNIRSVPWFSLEGDNSLMIFSGNYNGKEIQHWVNHSQNENGMADYIEEFLGKGELLTVVQAINIKPEIFSTVIAMLEDEETAMNIRIGLDALIENFTATELLKSYAESFKKIAELDDPRLQVDALHYLALTGDKSYQPFLQAQCAHDNPQVQEAAVEALETLQDLI